MADRAAIGSGGAAAQLREHSLFELSPAWIRRKLYFIERFPLSLRHDHMAHQPPVRRAIAASSCDSRKNVSTWRSYSVMH
jgi:hypothetical protein